MGFGWAIGWEVEEVMRIVVGAARGCWVVVVVLEVVVACCEGSLGGFWFVLEALYMYP